VAERLNITEAVAALRAELAEAILASSEESIRFEVGEIELAFEVAVERSASGGIRFWVVEIGAGGSSTETHTVRIPLQPIRTDGRPVLTGGADEAPSPPVPPTD
jgi:Trypsin-co-occurring domain 2